MKAISNIAAICILLLAVGCSDKKSDTAENDAILQKQMLGTTARSSSDASTTTITSDPIKRFYGTWRTEVQNVIPQEVRIYEEDGRPWLSGNSGEIFAGMIESGTLRLEGASVTFTYRSSTHTLIGNGAEYFRVK